MVILSGKISAAALKQMAAASFGDMVKGVVDTGLKLLAWDAPLHSDLEALLLQKGSTLGNLWGINLYPELLGSDFIEFDSMINMRPSAGNRTWGVDDLEIQKKIREVVLSWVMK